MSNLNPVPYNTPMQTPQGLLTVPWQNWFRQLMDRVGGNSATSNADIPLPISIANGGTGNATQAAAITALAGAQTSGKYLRSNGTNTLLAAIQGTDVPTLNQNTTGTAANIAGGLGGQVPYQSAAGTTAMLANGTAGQVLTSQGTTLAPDWTTVSSAFVSGMIIDFGGFFAPSGWLICDGSAISRTTYAALFAAISTTFGAGDGTTTFNLPDSRGTVSVGAGTGSGLTPRGLSAIGGEETHVITTTEMPSHNHTQTGDNGVGGGNTVNANQNGRTGANSLFNTTNSTGGGNAHNNMQPFLVLNRIIKT